MRTALIAALVLMTAAAGYGDGRKQLMDRAAAELKKLNAEVLRRIKNPAQYNHQDIYVRVRVLPQADGSSRMQIEKVTVGQAEAKTETVLDKDVIVFRGKLEKDRIKGDYKVDLSHVLPPEEDGKPAVAAENSAKKENKK